MLKFRVDGKEYGYDHTLPLGEAMLIKTVTGLTAGQFITEITQMDGVALAGMVLLAKIRAGEDTTWSDLATLDIIKLIESVGELNKPEAVEPAGEEPVKPARKQRPEAA